jgi:hypothetical protein
VGPGAAPVGRSCALDSSQDSTAAQQGNYPKNLVGQWFLM